MADLFESQLLGGTVPLKNRIVMAPMTRTRTSEGDVPNALMATYYGQRAGAGLIVSEVADVDPSSNGYAMTPGIYTQAQRQGSGVRYDAVLPTPAKRPMLSHIGSAPQVRTGMFTLLATGFLADLLHAFVDGNQDDLGHHPSVERIAARYAAVFSGGMADDRSARFDPIDQFARAAGSRRAPGLAYRPRVRYTLNHMVQCATTRLDNAFAALSDATRRGVLERLGRADASITDLAETFHMTLTGMKKHVGILERAGLVTTEKVGRVRTCRLGLRPLEEEAAWIERYRQLWTARFDELDEVVEELKQKEKVDGRRKRE